ncbi:MAG: class I tRNA ligase family protein [Bacillota bacterium]
MPDIDTDAVEKSEAAKREEEVLAFWKENHIFEKSLERGSEKNTFIFYDGPPTANGRPGVHHLEARAFKDAIPRYKTMRGFRVPRRAGWDTHGLPVELEVEKQLGFSGKKDIEEYGVAAFNKKCKESVFTYINEWERFTERIGYWVDMDNAYFTFDPPYMESLFSIVKKVHDDGRLYKDYKVLPWCPVCGTALSSHELAQGYEDVKDLSLTVKFKVKNSEKLGISEDVYLLAWTTTPWTLPGNIALAVGSDIDYQICRDGENKLVIVAKARNAIVHAGANPNALIIDRELKGRELVGLEYEPLYPFAEKLAPESEKPKFEKAFQVYPADFVTTEDGTGIVHTAVMYGQDDFELGQALGLPKVHLVAPDGKFIAGTGFLEGASVIEPETNIAVLKDLQERELFFSKENYQHSYPHCWRSKNRLIYYARDSWFIRMQDLRETMLEQNGQVNWEPSYIRDGRMGEWLANAKEWAISRERYWGTPLPVWESEDGNERLVIGSVDELKERTKRSGNRYFLMRHGEAENNTRDTLDASNSKKWPLTATGRAQVEKGAAQLKDTDITAIYASPFERTKETAEIVADTLGIDRSRIIFDDQLRELDFGDLDGSSRDEFIKRRDAMAYDDKIPGGESYQDAKTRFGSFLYRLEREHANENILVVSHGIMLETLPAVAVGADKIASMDMGCACNPECGEPVELEFTPLPHNDDYELDLHRPYIDDVVLVADSGNELRRVKEVMDVWFDSGAMPFAQDHYPFENKEWIDEKGFPADFISEAIDQTRGWFYTLLAVGVLMGKDRAYKNVICLGHLLDEKGQKMSKSKGNVIEPLKAVDRYGADTLRFWMYSVNQPGDSKNFDEKTVKEAARVISWLENSVKFYQLFAGAEGKGTEEVIDTWMRVRTSESIGQATAALDAYDLYTAARTVAGLIEDLSQWYVRRVRDRVRDGDVAAITTLRDTLQAIAVLMAPLAPFIAEWTYQAVREDTDPESVHLADWYEPGTVDNELVVGMGQVRELASEALRARQQAGVKVRQPLSSLSIPAALPKELAQLLADEVNVKEIIMNAEALTLDTTLTPELIREGDVREFARALADARKDLGLSPRDTVTLMVSPAGEEVLSGINLTGVSSISFADADQYRAELSSGPIGFSIRVDAS